jgi:hypothetical protein
VWFAQNAHLANAVVIEATRLRAGIESVCTLANTTCSVRNKRPGGAGRSVSSAGIGRDDYGFCTSPLDPNLMRSGSPRVGITCTPPPPASELTSTIADSVIGRETTI